MCAMRCFPTDNELSSTTTMATIRSTALVFAMMLEVAMAQVSRPLNPCYFGCIQPLHAAAVLSLCAPARYGCRQYSYFYLLLHGAVHGRKFAHTPLFSCHLQ
jgi:hypothetical protein